MPTTFRVTYVFKPKEARVFPRSANCVTVTCDSAEQAIKKIQGKRTMYDFKVLEIAEEKHDGDRADDHQGGRMHVAGCSNQ